MTDEEIKAYRLVDNKTAEFSGWDFPMLEEELSGIFDINMDEFGFNNEDSLDENIDKYFENYQSESNTRGKKHICPNCGYEY